MINYSSFNMNVWLESQNWFRYFHVFSCYVERWWLLVALIKRRCRFLVTRHLPFTYSRLCFAPGRTGPNSSCVRMCMCDSARQCWMCEFTRKVQPRTRTNWYRVSCAYVAKQVMHLTWDNRQGQVSLFERRSAAKTIQRWKG